MAKRRLKVPITYKTPDGVLIEYVPRYSSELVRELARVYTAVLQANRVLATLSRVRHIAIQSVHFQMANALRAPLSEFDELTASDEIARLSFIMEDAVGILSTLTNSRTANLQQLRFVLTYGQTPKKRDQPFAKEPDDTEEPEEVVD